ncbi:hypothetical protein [Thiolapillus sp.]
MKKIPMIIFSLTFALSLLGVAGCSDESQEKWKEAGKATGEAVKETAHEAKEGVKNAVKNAKPTDPDTGLAK